MEAYFLLLIFVIALIVFQDIYGAVHVSLFGKKYDIIPFVTYIVFLVFYAIRDYIGYDYAMYYKTVEGGYADDVYASKGEYISAGLLNIANYFNDPHVYFFLTAAISLACIVYACHKYIDLKSGLGWGMLAFLALPVGFLYTLSTQRQFVAIGIMMLGIRYLRQKRFFSFTGITILATMAHISSCFCWLLFFIQSKRINKKILAIIGIFGFFLASKATSLIAIFFPFYMAYIEMAIGTSGGGTSQFILYMLILLISVVLYYFMKEKETYNFFLKNYMFGFALMAMLFLFDASVSFRLGGFALLNAIFLIPLWGNAFSGIPKIFFKCILVLALSFAYYYGLITTVDDFYIPYKTFL